MRGLPDIHGGSGAPSATALQPLLAQALYGRADQVLDRLSALLPALEHGPDSEALMAGLHLRALALRVLGVPTEEALAACDLLEQAAQQRRVHGWTATAWALRARVRVDAGAIGEATAALANAHDHLEPEHLDGDAGFALLDALAETYHRLRLHDRAEETRTRLESTIGERSVAQRATHWTSWSQELAARAIEPLAGGRAEPDQALLDRAVGRAERVQALLASGAADGDGLLPAQLVRGASGVRALAAALRGHSAEAFALLGEDAFRVPSDLSPVASRLVTLAAMRAHAQVGSVATARNLDEAAAQTPARMAHLVLEVVRTRERLWLESYAGGDIVPVLDRMTSLLLRLGWTGMDLVADTARQALEHQALRAESRTDALTGVGNRRSMDEELRQLLRFSPLPTALVLIDVDDFKEINDRYSHVVGDEVLRRVAAALVTQLRSSDRLLRYGGDEFVALLPHTGDEEAHRVAGRMAAAVGERSWNELADGLRVTITTGCAAVWTLTGRRPDADAERLFLRADEQLLQAKRRRRQQPAGAPVPVAVEVAAPGGGPIGGALGGPLHGASGGAMNGPVGSTELPVHPLRPAELLPAELLPPDLRGPSVVLGEVVPEPQPEVRRGRRAAGPPDDEPLPPPSTAPSTPPSTPPSFVTPPTSSIPVPPVDRLPAVIDLARHDRPRPRRTDPRRRDLLEVHLDVAPGPQPVQHPGQEAEALADSAASAYDWSRPVPAADPYDWPQGDPLTDPWVDHDDRGR